MQLQTFPFYIFLVAIVGSVCSLWGTVQSNLLLVTYMNVSRRDVSVILHHLLPRSLKWS